MIPTVLIPALAFIGQIHAAPITPYYAHNISSLVGASSHSSACNDIHNCRTLWSIIYSCLATIFACTWVSYHPDVPDRTHTRWRIRVTRLLTVLVSFLVPEFTVAKAASECWRVWNYNSPFQGWTRAHTYFALMRGFFDSEQPDKKLKAWDMVELTADSHPEMFKLGPAPSKAPPEHPRSPTWILVTESEIRDKSKGDTLGKLVTLLQTTWFIAQYLGRWTTHQPRTQLEVMTLAYAALNVVVYALWWDKPLDIQEPIDVRRGRAIPVDVRREALWGAGSDIIEDAMESSFRNTNEVTWFALLPVVGALFGGVHCFAWWFPFPTKHEALLWKFCALYCTVGPASLVASGIAIKLIWATMIPCLPDVILDTIEGLGPVSFVTGYIVCRIILLVLTFTSLRAAGPAVYEATNWTFFFPHFG